MCPSTGLKPSVRFVPIGFFLSFHKSALYIALYTALYTALAARHVAHIEATIMPLLARFASEPKLDLVHFIVETMITIEATDSTLRAELRRLSLWNQTSGILSDFRYRAEARFAEVLRASADALPRPLEDPELAARIILRAVGGILDTQLHEGPDTLKDPRLVAGLTRLVAGYLGIDEHT